MIKENIDRINNEVGKNVLLVVVSKYRELEEVKRAYDTGHRDFAENRVQELLTKQEALPNDINWHIIGHLQTNKVKYIASFIDCIHSVDSLKLAKEINKQAEKNNRSIKVLLQVYIADEETKFGFDEAELIQLLKEGSLQALPHITICGLMGMATNTDNMEQVRSEFAHLKQLFNTLKADYFKDKADFKEISMGMSSDYRIAVEEGSTMVRVGSAVFN